MTRNPVDVIALAMADHWGEEKRSDDWMEYRGEAETILTALESAGCPVVPSDATPEMIAAAVDARAHLSEDHWEAMRKACAGWWRKEK